MIRRLILFIVMSAFWFVAWRLGADYLRSPGSDIISMTIKPLPDVRGRRGI